MRTATATALTLLLGLGMALPATAQQQQEGQAAEQQPAEQQLQQQQEGQAGQQQGTAATSGTEVTGVVTSTDEQTHEIVIDGQTFVMPEESGTAMMPAEGDKVTLFYREEGGQKVITRIGQPQQ